MPTTARFALTVGAIALTGAALAGCSPADTPSAAGGGSAATAAPAVYIAQAAESTRSSGSAHVTSVATISPADGSGATVRVDGVVNFVSDQAALRVSSSLFGGSADMQVILTGDQSYLQIPIFGEKWISAPLQELGVDLVDPAQSLDTLKDVTDLQRVGKEPLDGVEATKFTGTLDLADALKSGLLPAPEASAGTKAVDLSGTADVTVWVDNEGRVIRLDQSAVIDAGTGPEVRATGSTTLTDFGVETQIEAPPADQVVDAESLGQLADMTRPTR